MKKKRSKRRYKVADKIGAGAFATVYAAEDTKLNREVAIKQLHEQYLEDKDQLERYWQEAQLLGALDHPNIMTIFDVVRSKGCLILERMQGSLQQIYNDKPMPVHDVRQTISQVAQGLKCLHENGIIHGDVKPGNLFLSKQDVVKLGDFGLARRANDDDGSLVKGTTRYMAPELVSEEFGDVGPASDLYSLGFSALEMLVGPEFESLFPDLIAFGRDRQMAWMMWHCSPDRKLPPVQTLLEGVPDDLANVLQKLTSKDQSNRYTSAAEVLADLSGDTKPVGTSLKEEAAAAEELARQKKKKRRRFALLASVASLLLSLGIIYFAQDRTEPPERKVPPPVRGIVQNVRPIDQKLVLDLGFDRKEFKLLSKDKITLNRSERPLRDLELGDRVVIYTRLEPEGKSRYEIVAFRPATHTGVIQDIRGEENKFVLSVVKGEESGKEFVLSAPPETPITLNAMSKKGSEPYTFEALRIGDRVVVHHSDDESGMMALSIDALREVTLSGFVRKIEPRQRVITIALGESDEDVDSFVRIPLNSECMIKLNDLTSLNDQLVTFANLSPGDKVTLQHDTQVNSIDAYRVFYDEGAIVDIDYQNNSFSIDNGRALFNLNPDQEIELDGEPVQLADLRVGDQIKLSHDSPGESAPMVDSLTAIRPSDPSKWAILISNQEFNDNQIPKLSNNNAQRIFHSLVKRYAVPEEQAFLCDNFERVRIEQEISKWIANVPADAELYVYVSTRAFAEREKNVYLAAKDSDFSSMDETAIKLDWLIDQLDNCRTTKKLLLLDCTHSDRKSDSRQLAATDMIDVVRSTHRGGYPRSVFVLGSCQSGQFDINTPNGEDIGLFAATLADAFAGQADQAKDNKIEVTELADFVSKKVQSAANSICVIQQPQLILPDATPPRISMAARQSIIALLARFSEKRIDVDKVGEMASLADRVSGGQPEPMLAYGIILIKATKMDQAYEVLERVRLKHPSSLLAHRAVIWLHFYKTRYDDGFTKIFSMLEQIPKPDDVDGPYDETTLNIFEWSGMLREIATSSSDWNERVPSDEEAQKLDERASEYGDIPSARYEKGRADIRKIYADLASSFDAKPQTPLDRRRTRIRTFMKSIAGPEAIAEIRDGLDK